MFEAKIGTREKVKKTTIDRRFVVSSFGAHGTEIFADSVTENAFYSNLRVARNWFIGNYETGRPEWEYMLQCFARLDRV